MLESKYGMKYSFPHTLVHIVDNSAYTGDLPVVLANDPSMYGTLVVAGFPMGEDRRVINVNRSDILSVAYGLGSISSSDIKKYGQTITYPMSMIDQGAPVQLLRITPEDSTYAYSCITIEWKWFRDENKMHVRFGTYTLDNDRDLMNFQNKDRLASYIMKKAKSTGDEWQRRAFIVNVSAGRGSAYNRFATAINQTVQQKRAANIMYLFSTIDTLENTIVEQYHASLVNKDNKRTDAIDPVNIVIGKRAPGSSVVVQYMNEDAVSELYEDYRKYFKEMMDDASVIKTDYEKSVYKYLTVNTFDPIFGLYIYSGGTDENNKLPWFQVDMRSAEVPMLDPAQRVFIQLDAQGEAPQSDSDAITTKLVQEEISGIQIPGESVYVGDIYLNAKSSSKNNPYLYLVAAINQYTGAVTTVRTTSLKCVVNETTVYPELVSIIETDKIDTEAANTQFNTLLVQKLKSGAVVDGTAVARYDINLQDSSYKAWSLYYIKPGTRAKVLNNVAIVSGTDYVEIDVTKYDFINWGADTSEPNQVAPSLIGVYANDDAYNRVGATQIDLTADIETAGSVTVKGYDDATSYNVDRSTGRKILKYEDAPTAIDRTDRDTSIVGMNFDVFKMSTTDVSGYVYNNENPAAATDGINNRSIAATSQTDYQIGLDFAHDTASYQIRFRPTKSGTTVDLTEQTSNEIIVTDFAQEFGDSKTFFPLYQLVEGWYNDGKFYEDSEFQTEISAKGYNIYKDKAEGGKYYWYGTVEGTPTFVECVGLTDENQLVYWFTSDEIGNWSKATETPAETATYLSGWKFTVTSGNFNTAYDIDEADELDRYQITGTVGTLYRIQNTIDNLPNDYYSDEYGINITSTSGGVVLADGSTGFMDDDTMSSIEFKWRYSALLVEAFRGQIDPKIMSPNRCPFKYLIDGGWNTVIGQSSLPMVQYSVADIIMASTIFDEDEKDEAMFNSAVTASFSSLVKKSIDVKQAMYDLMEYRVYQGIPEDKRPVGPGSGMSLHLDSGITDVQTAMTINTSFSRRFDNPNASWDIGGYVSSVDGLPYTFTKRIADNLFRHCSAYNVNKPFVMTYTTIKSDEYVSYFPDVDSTDWEYRELMYNSGGNSWIPDVNGDLMRRSQRTLMRSSGTSDLIQENNMRTLTQLVYILQNYLETKLFEYNDDSILRTMQDEVNNMFTNWVGTMVDSLQINFKHEINPIDGGEVVECDVDVVFRGMNLRIPIIVNVNRRVYNQE